MLLTGVAGGVIAGLLGVGGGIVVVPVLEAALAVYGVDPAVRMHIAVGTSLATIVPTSISSALAHARKKSIDAGIARAWSPYILVGAVGGVVLSAFVSGRVLSGIFAVIAFLLAINMIVRFGEKSLARDVPGHAAIALLPFGIGGVSTLMGIGGGSMTVPALTVFNRPIHVAVGTSALFGFVIAVPAAVGYVVTGWGNALLPAGSLGYVNLIGFALITPASVLCAPWGARLAHATPRARLSVIFGLFLLAASLRMAYQAL